MRLVGLMAASLLLLLACATGAQARQLVDSSETGAGACLLVDTWPAIDGPGSSAAASQPGGIGCIIDLRPSVLECWRVVADGQPDTYCIEVVPGT
jgi:hypothetical protein